MPAHRYTREIPEPAPFLLRHGAQIRGIQIFPTIKITAVRQGAYVLRTECEDKRVKCRTACKVCGRILFAFVFACVVGKKQKTPNLSPMADKAITQGGIQDLGSP